MLEETRPLDADHTCLTERLNQTKKIQQENSNLSLASESKGRRIQILIQNFLFPFTAEKYEIQKL